MKDSVTAGSRGLAKTIQTVVPRRLQFVIAGDTKFIHIEEMLGAVHSSLSKSFSKPARYFPIERGLYEVGPGFKPLGFDFGNGEFDRKAFQIDVEFERSQFEKTSARKEDLSKYVGLSNLEPRVLKVIADYIVRQLCSEHPLFFSLEPSPEKTRFVCKLTEQTIVYDSLGRLLPETSAPPLGPPYKDLYDALISQIQEDSAIVTHDGSKNWLSAIHVTAPSHWDPREKLGRDFAQVHGPVPGFERMAKAQSQMIEAITTKGPFVRFVWSFVTDTRLNHHPEPPPGEDAVLWKGRSFEESDPLRAPFHLRVERQLTIPFANEMSALFLIRLSFLDAFEIRDDETKRTQLVSALKSMSPEARVYKGVAQCFDRLVKWLESPA